MLPGERLVGSLTCSQVLAELSAYLDGDLDPTRRGQVETHVAACQACATFGAGIARLLAEVRLRMASPDPVPDDIAARLHAALQQPGP